MSYVYVDRNGARVEERVAADFDRMNEAFHKDTGLHLVITSGTRTDAQQEALFRERYVQSGQVNGRKVYDTRWWQGRLWYRISSAGTVAAPGSSNHQESGPNGPRSIDIRDTGTDYGVTRRGTVRDKWMEINAPIYGFENEGYKFGEPWHKTDRNPIGDVPTTSTAGTTTGKLVFSQVIQDRQNFLISRNYDLGKAGADGLAGPKYDAAVKAYQTYLQGRGWYSGKIDGDWGPATQAAHAIYWNELNRTPPKPKYPLVSVGILDQIGNVEGLQKVAKLGGYKGKIDNDWGPNSQAGFQKWLSGGYGSVSNWLRKRWGYSGDDYMGPNMIAALQKANAANARAL